MVTSGTKIQPAEVIAAITLSLLVGHGVGGIAVASMGPPAGATSAVFPVWLFPTVWTVLFPCFAVATLLVAHARAPRAETRRAFARGSCAALLVVAWVPLACATDTAWVSVALDLVAWAVLWAASRAYARVSRRALRWMVPLLVWMPITTAVSVAVAIEVLR